VSLWTHNLIQQLWPLDVWLNGVLIPLLILKWVPEDICHQFHSLIDNWGQKCVLHYHNAIRFIVCLWWISREIKQHRKSTYTLKNLNMSLNIPKRNSRVNMFFKVTLIITSSSGGRVKTLYCLFLVGMLHPLKFKIISNGNMIKLQIS
jgi:hypothetical protein